MSGPFTEFKKFEDWVNYRGDFAKLKPWKTLFPALIRFISALFCIGVFQAIYLFIDPEYLSSDAFKNEAFGMKIFYMMLCFQIFLWKFYTAFLFMDSL
jgi:hypothetical protein